MQEPTIDPYSNEGISLSQVEGAIAFKDVRFSYPSRKDIEVLSALLRQALRYFEESPSA